MQFGDIAVFASKPEKSMFFCLIFFDRRSSKKAWGHGIVNNKNIKKMFNLDFDVIFHHVRAATHTKNFIELFFIFTFFRAQCTYNIVIN